MRSSDVVAFVGRLGQVLPPVEEFFRLGDLTGLRRDESGRFYRANYERGILLYALVAAYRPRTLLEFGTGRGYGCLCAARAMADQGIDGRVFTIDMVGDDEAFEWPIDEGAGPRVARLCRSEVWARAVPAEWRRRIEPLRGRTGQVMRRWPGPPVECAFIDAGHGYASVRHDFYSLLGVAAERFGILFDDYAPTLGFGVQQLVDEEVAEAFGAELVYTDRRWPGGERAGLADPVYGMVWAHSDGMPRPLAEACPSGERDRFLRAYRRREAWPALKRRARVFVGGWRAD